MSDARKLAEDYCRGGIVVSVDGIEALIKKAHADLLAERDRAVELLRGWYNDASAVRHPVNCACVMCEDTRALLAPPPAQEPPK